MFSFFKCFFICTFLLSFGRANSAQIDQVVIWGHKLHSHTHSYIHYGFYKAFKHLGYKTLWLDNKDDVSAVDFRNTLFVTEHQVDQKMPLRDDCYYFVHCSSHRKYEHLKQIKHFIDLDVYKNSHQISSTLHEIEPYIFYDFEKMYLLIMWATDLLPEEIERNKPRSFSHMASREKVIYWVGTIGEGKDGNYSELAPFIQACKDHGVQFIQSDPWRLAVDADKHIQMIQRSYLAPAICGAIQVEKDYIPCRIFKNISYGHLGLTNSKAVNDLFGGRLSYDSDPYQLFLKGEAKLIEGNIKEQHELMDFVKNHHTYLNRVQHMLTFIEKSQDYWSLR